MECPDGAEISQIDSNLKNFIKNIDLEIKYYITIKDL